MKMFFLFALGAIIFFSCTNNQTNNMQKHDAAASADSLRNNPGQMADGNNGQGAQLIAGSDCLSCHKINMQSVGPSYDSVAARYENNQGNVENLAHKIIHGGQGQWTVKAAMPPHDNLSEPDAETMVRYILSLRKS